jgi:hypothetical protein
MGGASRRITNRDPPRRGFSTLDIEAPWPTSTGSKVGHELISRVTDTIVDDDQRP